MRSMYIDGPMGRAYRYSRSQVVAMAEAVGFTPSDDDSLQDICRRINIRVSPGGDRYLANLRAFRKACHFSQAARIQVTRDGEACNVLTKQTKGCGIDSLDRGYAVIC